MSDSTSSAELLIHIERLDFGYASTASDAQQWRIRANDLRINRGAFYSVLGPNMSGKSTLLRLVQGSALVESDSLTVLDVSGRLVQRDARSSRLTVNDQVPLSCMIRHDDPMFPELSLWDNVRLARPRFATNSNTAALATLFSFVRENSTLKSAGVSPLTTLGELSSGGRALVRLARATIWGALLVLVDEVTAHLDDSNATLFLAGLLPSIRNGGAVMMVSHQARDHELARELVSEADLAYGEIHLSVQENVTCMHVA